MPRTDTLPLDKTWLYGLMLLVLSLTIFCIPLFVDVAKVPEGLFFVNYIIAIVYLIVIAAAGRLSLRRGNALAPVLVLLVISLVSCYALNRAVPIVVNQIPWWSTLLVIVSVNFLATPFYPYLPRGLQYLSCAIAGIALTVFFYQAIYLLPLYGYCLLGILAIGLGLHAFVPLLFIIYTIVFIRKAAARNRRRLYAFVIGASLTLAAITQFNFRWSAVADLGDRDRVRETTVALNR